MRRGPAGPGGCLQHAAWRVPAHIAHIRRARRDIVFVLAGEDFANQGLLRQLGRDAKAVNQSPDIGIAEMPVDARRVGLFLGAEVYAAQPPHDLILQVSQAFVGEDAGRARLIDDIHLGIGHHGCALGDADDALADVRQVLRVKCAYIIIALGIIRHDIWRQTAVEDDIMQPGIIADMLAQVIDADVHQLQGIQGRTPRMRIGSGMGRAAMKAKVVAVDAEQAAFHGGIEVPGMPVEGGVQIVKSARAAHEDFAAAAFFCRAAIIAHRASPPRPLQPLL